jgi:hypothetical protein
MYLQTVQSHILSEMSNVAFWVLLLPEKSNHTLSSRTLENCILKPEDFSYLALHDYTQSGRTEAEANNHPEKDDHNRPREHRSST